MSFFSILKPLVTKPDDKLAVETDGILSGNSSIKNAVDGTMWLKPNVPQISMTPSPSERYNKSLAFQAGNRQLITEPIDPLAEDNTPKYDSLQPSGAAPMTSAGSGVSSDGKALGEAPAPSGSTLKQSDLMAAVLGDKMDYANKGTADEPQGASYGYRDTAGRTGNTTGSITPPEEGASQKAPSELTRAEIMANNQRYANKAVGDAGYDEEGMPIRPDDKRVPDEEDLRNDPRYHTSKWKDILAGILQGVGSTDFNKYRPDQQLAALIGAAGGGAFNGAATGSYAGRQSYEGDRARAINDNNIADAQYNRRLDSAGKRISIDNAKLAPVIQRERIESANKIATMKSEQAADRLKLTANAQDIKTGILLSKEARESEKFRQQTAQLKNIKAVQNTDGSDGYHLEGQNVNGKFQPLLHDDGTPVPVSDPVSGQLLAALIGAAKDEAVGSIPEEDPEVRMNAVKNSVAKADQLYRIQNIEPVKPASTSGRDYNKWAAAHKEWEAGLQREKDAAAKLTGDSYDKANTNNRKTKVAAKTAGNVKQVINSKTPNKQGNTSNKKMSVPMPDEIKKSLFKASQQGVPKK